MSGAVSKRGRELLAQLVKEGGDLYVDGPTLKTARALERAQLVFVESMPDCRQRARLLGPGRRWLRDHHPELLIEWHSPPEGTRLWLRAMIRHELKEEENTRRNLGKPGFRGDTASRVARAVQWYAGMDERSTNHPIDDEGRALAAQWRALEEVERFI